MASSHDATSPCDLLQGIVAGTSPSVCAEFKDRSFFMKEEGGEVVVGIWEAPFTW